MTTMRDDIIIAATKSSWHPGLAGWSVDKVADGAHTAPRWALMPRIVVGEGRFGRVSLTRSTGPNSVITNLGQSATTHPDNRANRLQACMAASHPLVGRAHEPPALPQYALGG